MTKILGKGVIVIEPEAAQQCDLCGVIAELRPYGPNGECICFDCGQKDLAATIAAFAKRVGITAPEEAR